MGMDAPDADSPSCPEAVVLPVAGQALHPWLEPKRPNRTSPSRACGGAKIQPAAGVILTFGVCRLEGAGSQTTPGRRQGHSTAAQTGCRTSHPGAAPLRCLSLMPHRRPGGRVNRSGH